MAEASIPVDLFNPGQVFACLGFAEAADQLVGDATAVFDWSSPTKVAFVLRAAGDDSPIETVLRFLADARVVALVPHGSPHVGAWTESWGSLEELSAGAPSSVPEPPSPATLAAALRANGSDLLLDHWGDGTARKTIKMWAGAGGYPGAAFARDALALIRDRCAGVATDPFALAAPQSSSFRFDWRRDYIPIDAGFSLNEHKGSIETVGFPLVELLAEIGLGAARPVRLGRLEYRYGAVGRSSGSSCPTLPLSILRAALGAPTIPFDVRRFRMHLGWPGKEGQARAITTVTEETTR